MSSDAAFSDIFSYGECRTQADGFLDKQVATTTVSSSVSNVRMTNRPSPGEADNLSPIEFRSTFLSVSLRSTHLRKGEPRIVFAEEPHFDGLYLNNLPIQVELRRPFVDLPRLSDLDKRFRTNRKFYDDCRSAFLLANPGEAPPSDEGCQLIMVIRSAPSCSEFIGAIRRSKAMYSRRGIRHDLFWRDAARLQQPASCSCTDQDGLRHRRGCVSLRKRSERRVVATRELGQ